MASKVCNVNSDFCIIANHLEVLVVNSAWLSSIITSRLACLWYPNNSLVKINCYLLNNYGLVGSDFMLTLALIVLCVNDGTKHRSFSWQEIWHMCKSWCFPPKIKLYASINLCKNASPDIIDSLIISVPHLLLLCVNILTLIFKVRLNGQCYFSVKKFSNQEKKCQCVTSHLDSIYRL